VCDGADEDTETLVTEGPDLLQALLGHSRKLRRIGHLVEILFCFIIILTLLRGVDVG